MHLSSISVIVMTVLATTGSALKIDTFKGTDCNTPIQQGVDIWDDTVADWPKPFQSFKVLYWGRPGQHVNFYSAKDGQGDALQSGKADGPGQYRIGECNSMYQGGWAHSIQSWEVIFARKL